MSLSLKLALNKRAQAADGKTDLLLRFFESHFFDEWIALQYLFQNTQPGVQDYLCNKLYELGETAIEKYLLQFVYLAVNRPGQALERTIIDLCSRSFRIAIKVQWLLQALCQDHPKNKALEGFRDRCYKAALEGKWEVPFRNPRLDPLSPITSQLLSPTFSPALSPPFSPDSTAVLQHLSQQAAAAHSPTTQPPSNVVMSPPGHSGPKLVDGAAGTAEVLTLAHRRTSSLQIDLGCLLPVEQRILPPEPTALPAVSAVDTPTGHALPNGAAPSPPPPPQQQQLYAPQAKQGGAHHMLSNVSSRTASPFMNQPPLANGTPLAAAEGPDRYQLIRRELGEGEGVTALLERTMASGHIAATEDEGVLSDDEFSGRPMSPLTRLRYDTFGATLDFIDALCDASSQLASYPQDERHRALRYSLEGINRELETANRRDVAIWFPIGHRKDRVLRITSKEAVLLNSREKAPFMLFVEVLEQPQDDEALDVPLRPPAGHSSLAGAVASAPGPAPGPPLATVSSSAFAAQAAKAPAVEFGRPETYGVALTAVGGNHHALRASQPPAAIRHNPQPSTDSTISLVSGRVSLQGIGTAPSDSAGTSTTGTWETPVGLSPAMSLSSQQRSSATSPVAGPHPGAASAHLPATANGVATGSSSGRGHAAAAASSASLPQPAVAAVVAAAECLPGKPPLAPAPCVAATAAPTTAQPSAILIPSRSTNSFAKLLGSSGGGGSGRSSLEMLRPPAAAALAAAPALEVPPPPVLPTAYPPGSQSPVLAAKEASASQLGSSVLSAGSSLLRRVLGDKAAEVPAVAASARDDGSGSGPASTAGSMSSPFGRTSKEVPSGFSVVRSLCFSNPEPSSSSGNLEAIRPDGIGPAPPQGPAHQSSSGGGVGLPSAGLGAISRAAILARELVRGTSGNSSSSGGGIGSSVGSSLSAHLGLSLGAAQHHHAQALALQALPLRPGATEMTEDELQELLAAGCLSPPPLVKTDPVLSGKMLNAMASLRGEAALVKLTIRVLPPQQPQQPQQQQPSPGAAAGTGSLTSSTHTDGGGGAAALSSSQDSAGMLGASGASGGDATAPSSGLSLSAFSLSNLTTSAKAKLLAASAPALPQPPTVPSPSSDPTAESGILDRSKAMLSKLGLYKRLAGEEDGVGQPGGATQAPHAAGLGPSMTTSAFGAAQWAARQAAKQEPRLVAVRLEVLQGMNLAIPSPYRKSRRTPSHEAIEALAGKYKIHQMPPPCESGPPLLLPAMSSTFDEADEHEQEAEHEEASFSNNLLSAVAPAPDPAKLTAAAAALGPGPASTLALLSVPAPAPPPPVRISPHQPAAARRSSSSTSGGELRHQPASSASSVALDPQGLGATANGLFSSLTASPPTPKLQLLQPARQQPSGGGVLSAHGGAAAQPAAASSSRGGGGGGFTSALSSSLSRIISRAAGNADSGSAVGSSPEGGSPYRGSDIASAPAQQGTPARFGPGSGAASAQKAATAAGAAAAPAGAPRHNLEKVLSAKAAGMQEEAERRRRDANAIYGERWAQKVKRIQRESPHGRRPGWSLRCVIVKSGDDCRQELLALQLIRTFGDLFKEAGLPLWVRHYEVLVTSNRTALIELVPDTLSVHTLKSRTLERSNATHSLSDHFFAKFTRGSPECVAAQRRFTESLAAYSLVCYLLQIKDRHNGNILMDDEGRIIHIDFGFLLSNSPGGVNFEAAPFKLTRELLEVMDSNSDGKSSELFDYFKVLMIQGFLACRKHVDRVLLLVRMMAKSGFPCFKAGDRAVKALEKRLQLGLTEVQCVQHVLTLISDSLDAWRTRQYDYYQRVLNGIL